MCKNKENHTANKRSPRTAREEESQRLITQLSQHAKSQSTAIHSPNSRTTYNDFS